MLTLVARVELRDVKANKVLWSNPACSSASSTSLDRRSAGDPNAFLRQDVNALDRLATEFARAVVSAMLEAF